MARGDFMKERLQSLDKAQYKSRRLPSTSRAIGPYNSDQISITVIGTACDGRYLCDFERGVR
jgi:hypothetical protein